MVEFNKRPVGRTAVEVTEFGFGSATLAGMNRTDVPPDQARATVTAALDAGVGYFDTAPHYGFGRAEHYMGDALHFRDDGIVISPKAGRLLRPVRTDKDRTVPHPWTQPFPFEIVYDYSYAAIRRSFEASLQRLGLAKIDILLVHDIGTQPRGGRLSRPARTQKGRPRRRHRYRRQRVAGADGCARARRLGRVPARQPLHADRAGSPRSVPFDLPQARHVGARRGPHRGRRPRRHQRLGAADGRLPEAAGRGA